MGHWAKAGFLFAILLLIFPLAQDALAKTFVVNTVSDEDNDPLDSSECRTAFSLAGQPRCTLRAAIQAANFSPGSDIIQFNIPAEECFFDSFCVIQLTKPLPSLRPRFDVNPRDIASLTIDAARAECSPATPCIVIDGGLLSAPDLTKLKSAVPDARNIQEAIDQLLTNGIRFRDDLVQIHRRVPGAPPFSSATYNEQLNNLSQAFPPLPDPFGIEARQVQSEAQKAATENNVSEALRKYQLLLEMVARAPGHCLHIDSNDNTVRGLILNRCPGNGIEIHGSGNVVQGAKIGTDAKGLEPEGNKQDGLRIFGALNSFDPAPCPFQNDSCRGNPSVAVASSRNWIQKSLISGNRGYGVAIIGGLATLNRIEGNKIGTNILGNKPLPNLNFGVFIARGASKNLVGNGSDTAGNLISGNQQGGIHISGNGTNENEMRKNFIGTDALGETRLGNSGHGILITCGASFNRIGTPGSPLVSTGNTIAFNSGHGILLRQAVTDQGNAPEDQGCTPPSRNTISSNSIYLNGDGITSKGIRLESSANEGRTPPTDLSVVIIPSISGNRTSIQGKTDCVNCVVEIFSDAGEFAKKAPDGSFIDVQGRFYEGFTVTDAKGSFRFDEETAGLFVTATVTDHVGNTSEFSKAIAIALPGSPTVSQPTITSVNPNSGDPGQTLNVMLTGNNFLGATNVNFGASITVNSFTINSNTQITANITISPTATPGGRTVSVTGSGGTGTLVNGFAVAGATPSDITARVLRSLCTNGRAIKMLVLSNQRGSPTGNVTIANVTAASGSNWTSISFVSGVGRTLRDGGTLSIIARGACTGSNLNLKIELSGGVILTADLPEKARGRELEIISRSGLLMIRAVGSSNVARLSVQIFSLSDRKLFEAQAPGRHRAALLLDRRGWPLANGVYLVVVTVERVDGTIHRELVKLAVLR